MKTKKNYKLTASYLENVAQLLRMLAHPHRLRIIEILEREEEVAVHQLIDEVGISQSGISLHLNQMKRMGLLKSVRNGREVWYRIKDPRVFALLNCISTNCPETEKIWTDNSPSNQTIHKDCE